MSLQFDIALFENDNGGDVLVKGNDLVKYYNNEGQIYLALFGGNVAEDTPVVPTVGKERFDYFGNIFLSTENQFNSRTERTLNTTPLTSVGRGIIQSAIEYDLIYLKPYANVTVEVAIIGINTAKVSITTNYFTGRKNLTTFTYSKFSPTGDFSLLDFYFQDFY